MTKTQLITETSTAVDATAIEGKPGKLLIGVISPGQGSSGFYSQEVLEAAGTDKVFPKGTHMYFNHPTLTEREERPERDVLTIGAVFETDAVWDDDLGKLVAEAEIVGPFRPWLTDEVFMKAVGTSIVASAEVDETDKGVVVTRLVEGKSVDFVTRAGRGGSILNLLESASPERVNAKAVAHGVTEATVNDKREALSTIVRDEYSADKTWVWLRDFDDDVAYFDIESDDSATYQQAYTTGDDGMPTALTGERTEVRVSTTYVPVVPAGPTPTKESKEDTMTKIQIEESTHVELLEKAGRADAAEAEAKAQKERGDAAERKLAESDARTDAEKYARKRVLEANATLPARTVDRVVRESLLSVPLTDKHELDEAAFDKVVDDAKTAEEAYLGELAEAAGVGSIQGFGASTPNVGEVSEADYDAAFNTKKED